MKVTCHLSRGDPIRNLCVVADRLVAAGAGEGRPLRGDQVEEVQFAFRHAVCNGGCDSDGHCCHDGMILGQNGIGLEELFAFNDNPGCYPGGGIIDTGYGVQVPGRWQWNVLQHACSRQTPCRSDLKTVGRLEATKRMDEQQRFGQTQNSLMNMGGSMVLRCWLPAVLGSCQAWLSF